MTIEVVGSREEWLDLLHPGDRAAILDVLAHSVNELNAASTWVEMATTDELIPHGGGRRTRTLAHTFIKEVHELLCGTDPKYAEARRDLGATVSPQTITASAISAALAEQLHVAPTLLAPALTLVLIVGAVAGKETMCQTFGDYLASYDDQPPGEGVD